jgi:hypothetical protein
MLWYFEKKIMNSITSCMTVSVVWLSEFLTTDPEVRVTFPALPDFLRSSGCGMGPLNLVSTTEELLGKKK